MKRVDKVVKDIKSVKIQGARNIAKAALKVYHLNQTKEMISIQKKTQDPSFNSIFN